jgi:hypothetical protein
MWGGPALQWADWRNPEATLYTLDDAMKETEWGSINMGVGTVVHALTTALSSLCDVVTPADQVRLPVLLTFFFPFRASDLHPFYSPSWLIARRCPVPSSPEGCLGPPC